MSNGFSAEQMLELVYGEIKELRREVTALASELAQLNASGCARSQDYIGRIESLERWRTRGIIGVISLLIGVVASFFRR